MATKEKGEMAFKSDIIDEMENRLDMDRTTIEKNVDLMLKLIKERAEKPEVGSLFISHLGTMYYEINVARSLLKRIDFKPKGEKMKMHFAKYEALKHFANYRSDRDLHTRIRRISNKFLNMGMGLKEQEEFQNRIYDEQTK